MLDGKIIRPFFLAIEGNIGSGKTTLCRLLASHYGSATLIGPYEENPFLQDFYRLPERYAFETELTFLALRYSNLRQAETAGLFSGLVLSDYLFERSTIFAAANLRDKELELFMSLLGQLAIKVRQPDLIVYLQASSEFLLQRITRRGRSWEQSIRKEYLDLLNEEFDNFIKNYEIRNYIPIIKVNAEQLDVIDYPSAIRDLATRLEMKMNS